MTLPERPITILIAALGGEGGGVMADWLMEAATKSGLPAQATSIPGVAQRTGATTYYLEIYPARKTELAGREPVPPAKVTRPSAKLAGIRFIGGEPMKSATNMLAGRS